ncbi:hypothetical protein KW787_03735 [Candidatus Pacearchaeota archaeon]|nr:hypothetical protein [Candidatus Pacearchaeota archaeon]
MIIAPLFPRKRTFNPLVYQIEPPLLGYNQNLYNPQFFILPMMDRIYRFFVGGTKYANEFWHEVRMLIVFTLGFTIAFTWRQTVFDTMEAFVQWLTNVHNITSLSILTSSFTTIFCILIIAVVANFLKDKAPHKSL